MSAGQYVNAGFLPNDAPRLNALKIFTLFANHDKNVFGYTRFKILDNRILQGQTAFKVHPNKQYVVELQPDFPKASARIMALAPSIPHSSCLLVYNYEEAGYTVHYYKVGSTCIITSYGMEDDLVGVGGSTGGGGGGSTGDTGGGGGDDDPPGWEPLPIEDEPQDPCVTAQNAAKIMDYLFTKSKADSILATIPNLATDTLEKGFPIIKKFSVNPNDATDTTTTGYRIGAVQTGTDSSIDYTFTYSRFEIPVADLHTHPPKGYSAHSAKDIYELIENRIQSYHYEGSFVGAANGSQYALTVTDYNLAAAFYNTKSQNLDSAKWNEDSDIGKSFEKAYSHFENGDPTKKNFAYEMAMAAVLNKFGAGVTLHKKDAAGNFKPIVVKTSPSPKNARRTVYTQECI